MHIIPIILCAFVFLLHFFNITVHFYKNRIWFEYISILVQGRRLELPRAYAHYPLKVARLPIPPSLHE